MIKLTTIVWAVLFLSTNVFANHALKSPDGNVSAHIIEDTGHLSLKISRGGAAVLLPSPIGITLDGIGLGKKAEKNFLPMQDGDVPATYANVDDLVRDIDFKPATTIEEGISRFVDWYREYYQV